MKSIGFLTQLRSAVNVLAVMRRIGLCLIFLLAAIEAAAGPAGAKPLTGTPMAPLPNAALQLTAYDGYVVFSELGAAHKWRLMAWSDGATSTLDAPERVIPFDASAGPSADGAPVVVFSKCTQEPPASPSEPDVQAPRLDWAKAAGCHVYELALPDGTPRLVRAIYAAGLSDSTPAIWMGNIAFARIRRGSRAPTLYVWDDTSGRLNRVGGGPGACPALSATFGSPYSAHAHPQPSAWVDAMSLDGGSLTYQWTLPEDDENPFGEPFAEIRVDPLRDGRQGAPSQVVNESIAGGACNGGEAGSPAAAAGSVLYTWHESICTEIPEKQPFSVIGSYSSATRKYSRARVSPGLAAAVTQDHGATYWIRIRNAFKAKNPQLEAAPDDYSETCAPALTTCTLMRTDDLASELSH
jgi:hypothetical protein